MTVAITKRMHTIVIGGTPELRMVFELTNERPQNSTVPQTASSGRVLVPAARTARGRDGAWLSIVWRRGYQKGGGYSSFSFFSFGEITIRQ